jgi:hypothetical protein
VPLADDLDKLEKSIRQLQIEWDKFFGGIERKPPNDLKFRVEQLVRQYAHQEIRNNAERFRYQSLTARYNTLNELWSKKLRAIEEGKPLGVHGLKADQLPPSRPTPPRAAAAAAASPAAAAEVRVQNPSSDAQAVKALYEQFMQARKAAGEAGAVKFDNFQKLIAQQASRILTEKGARAVDFRLETKDGKVSLKAKPVR